MSTQTYRASPYLKAAGKLGVEATVGSEKRQALEDYTPGKTLTVDFTDPAGAVERIVRFAETHPLAAVLAVDDQGVEPAARAAEALGLPHHPPETARAMGSKHRIRQILSAAGLPSPPFVCLAVDGEPDPPVHRVPYPCVLKPLHLAASRGVIRADNDREFRAAFRRIAGILQDPEVRRRNREEADSILVEGFIPGTEVALEGLLCDGELKPLAIFDKPDPLDGPHFEETIYVTPSALPAAAQEEIAACARRSAAALGLRQGPFHGEFRLNPDGVWPIDLAARSIGGNCSGSLRFRGDRKLEEIILRHALGMELANLELEPGASGVMMIPIPAAGTLVEVVGLWKAQKVAGISDVQITLNPGQKVVPLPEGNRYLGFLFARGETPGEVVEALREAHRQLRIEIR